MWIFGPKAKLLRTLDKLATYNDKGIDWSRHAPEQVMIERAAYISKIKESVALLGAERLPPELLTAIDSGALAEDGTGQYVAAVKMYFRSSGTL